MTLARTALRLQAVEVLSRAPELLALLNGRVFDSRIGDIDIRETGPVILVTAEAMKGKAYSANNGGVPFDNACDLVLEIAMMGRGTVAGVEGEVIGYAATDRQIEGDLDLIEEIAVNLLTAGETPEARLLRKAVTRRVTEANSDRFSSADTGVKLGVKLVTLRVHLKGEDQRDVTRPPGGPFAVLPDPLRTVCELAPTGSSMRKECLRLAGRLSPEEIVPFLGADVVQAPQSLDPTTPPDRAADVAAGRTLGQDITLADWTAPHVP